MVTTGPDALCVTCCVTVYKSPFGWSVVVVFVTGAVVLALAAGAAARPRVRAATATATGLAETCMTPPAGCGSTAELECAPLEDQRLVLRPLDVRADPDL